MLKSWIPLAVIFFATTIASADPITWLLRTPATGVHEGDTAQIELVAINAQQTTQAIDPPATITGDIGEVGDRSKIELKRVGEAPNFVPVGGFVAVPYNVVVPNGIGDRVIHLRTPIEATTVLRVLAARPAEATTQNSFTLNPAATTFTTPEGEPTTQLVTPKPLSQDETSSRLPTTSSSGTVEYVRNKFSPHEPTYFLIGNDTPKAKFQISLKYQLFDDQSSAAVKYPWLTGFFVSYTQTSFWAIEKQSAPFLDNTYHPEIFWAVHDIRAPKYPDTLRFDFQTGFQHESNGKAGADSRTINSYYIQPVFTLGDRDARFIAFAPRARAYLGSLDENPDVTHYYGYFDLIFIMGEANGLQARIDGRIGDDWDKGSVQLDLSYPLRKLLFNNLDVYLHAQLYNGYGESLLRYNEHGTSFRVGVSIVR